MMAAADPALLVGAVEWARPWALVLLAVPLYLLLAARRRSSRTLAAADLEPWRGAARETGAARPRAWRPPSWALACALLSITFAALAAAGPRLGASARTWIAVLDRSPSMHLDDGGRTRLEHAVEAALSLAAGQGVALRWCAPPLEPDPVDALPAAWREAPRAPLAPPAFEAFDAPGVVWVSDRAPEHPPQQAGFVAAGGAAVPGTVAVDGRDRIAWDGERLVRVAGAAAPRGVAVRGELPADGPLERVVRAWCAARGLAFGAEPDAATALVLHVADAPAAEALEAGRDGWSAAGELRGAAPWRDADGALEAWLAQGPLPLVTHGPGRVHVGWIPAGAPTGDPAAFAVSWARLLDACLLDPAGVVPLGERRDAGAAARRPPRAPAGSSGSYDATLPLALAALAAAAMALLARGR